MVFSAFQERKAEKSLETLKELAAPQVTVMRNGKWVKAPSKALVLGDIIKFSSGDRIGADVRLVEASSLYIEESALTGVRTCTKKVEALQGQDVAIGDQKIWFYGDNDYARIWYRSRCSNWYEYSDGANCKYVAKCRANGNATAKKVRTARKNISIVALILTALVVLAGVYQGNEVYHMFLAGVSLAVAAIPEGLPAIVTVALSLVYSV